VYEYDLICKIHEIRSYIASDWPGIEERMRLYEALKELEKQVSRLNNPCSDSENGSSAKPQ
jgi:hypothetical protein